MENLDSLLKVYSSYTGNSVQIAQEILRICTEKKLYRIGKILSQFFSGIYQDDLGILYHHALFLFHTENYQESYNVYDKILEFGNLPDVHAKKILVDQNKCVPLPSGVADNHIYYNPTKIKQILIKPKCTIPMITFTITTCKRFDLFEKTINSFLNCCLDLDRIDRWICVDDNSSEDDRKKMQERYPFFEFYMKKNSEKGHPISMNIILDKVTTPYIFHMEDDWKFFCKKNYITQCLDVLSQKYEIGQCLINKNYSEVEKDIGILGGEMKTCPSGQRYFVHEYCPTQEQQAVFSVKHGSGYHVNYWPHFSFRPSLIKTQVIKSLGKFDEKVSHFEMEFSRRYTEAGYVSTFLEGIYCLHIGRLTSERDDETKLNAYVLNGEKQLFGKEETGRTKIIKTRVINLDRRPDRWEKFQKQKCEIPYDRFSAVDGMELKPSNQLQRIFEGNDYNMRAGMVGCAMSHIKLYIDFLTGQGDILCVLEDDIEFVPDFKTKLEKVVQDLESCSWDLCYLGHHAWGKYQKIRPNLHDKKLIPEIEKWDAKKSLEYSIGGTGGYLISKQGAKNLLEFINTRGMTNGIDTVQQKSADTLNVYYCEPHLIYGECWDLQPNVDSDIQHTTQSLSLPPPLCNNLGYPDRLKKNGVFDVSDCFGSQNVVISLGDNTHISEAIKKLTKPQDFPFDTIDGETIDTVSLLLEMTLSMTDNELENFIIDFCDPSKNETYHQKFNNKTVFRNTRYRISFPHDNINTLIPTYVKRFKNLRDTIKSNNNVLFVHGTRWIPPVKQNNTFYSLIDLVLKYNKNVKILTINGVTNVEEKYQKYLLTEYVEFPEKFRMEEWTHEKISYDQNIFRNKIIEPIRKCIDEFTCKNSTIPS